MYDTSRLRAQLSRRMNEPDTLGFGGGHAILACVALVSRRYRTPDRVGQTIVANGRARICPELGLSHPLPTSLRTLLVPAPFSPGWSFLNFAVAPFSIGR